MSSKSRTATSATAALSAVLSVALWAAESAAQQAGEIEFTRGVATAQQQGASARLLSQGAPVARGDTLSTGANSFAVVRFTDGTKMTLRPSSVLQVDNYAFGEEKEDSFAMRLVRGGLRAVTGLITRRSPNAASIATSTATIGIRGTDFDARLCESDCAKDTRAGRPKAEAVPVKTAARVAQLDGSLTAIDIDGGRRTVVAGGPTYAGETLETGPTGHAVLVFRDDTRVTLQARTRMKIEEYAYQAARPGEGGTALGLLRGGLRVLTGLLGKQRPASFRLNTAVATIGIRGTGFDAYCEGSCAGEPAAGERDGLIAYTWDGEISLGLCPGEFPVKSGQAARMAVQCAQPQPFDRIPSYILDNPAPRPDRIPAGADQLFAAAAHDPDQSGLYVHVRGGHLQVALLDGRSVDISGGETAFVDTGGQALNRIREVPTFIRRDPTPLPTTQPKLMDLLGGSALPVRESLMCR